MKFRTHRERDNNITAQNRDGRTDTVCLLTLVKRNHNPLGDHVYYMGYIYIYINTFK